MMIRVALLSRWHVHADDYAREASKNPSIAITVIWDEDPARGKRWADELGVDFENSLEYTLAREDVDAVIVDTPTAMHKEVILAAAKAKKHIFSEKVLALTEEDVEDIFTSVDEHNVSLMLSLPRLNDPTYLYAEQALQEGLLGELTSIRCRLEHGGALPTESHPNGWLPSHFFNKEQCGGGALIDLGAHPIYLTNRFGGDAVSLYADMASYTDKPVDDHATVIVRYASGATATIEAGFIASKSPFILELHGTDGTILVEERSLRIQSTHLDESGWITPELPEQAPSAMSQWVAHIENGEEPRITREDMRLLTRINEAAIQSSEAGKRIELGNKKHTTV
ncbi:Gfo/Idh/MocA family protein [Shouchella miscanthi]|uniref:Gfo/Idh/MocA family protein n=1 Tax=Shouchella miscanthi TaxID=2598861 RepID=UPI00346272E3